MHQEEPCIESSNRLSPHAAAACCSTIQGCSSMMRAPHELHLSAARVTMHAYHSLSATTASIFTSKRYLCTFMNVITRCSFGLLLLRPPLLMQKSALRPMPVAPHRMCSAAVHLQRQTSMPYAPEQAAPELPKQCITLHCPPDSAHVVHKYLRLLSASHPRLIHYHAARQCNTPATYCRAPES